MFIIFTVDSWKRKVHSNVHAQYCEKKNVNEFRRISLIALNTICRNLNSRQNKNRVFHLPYLCYHILQTICCTSVQLSCNHTKFQFQCHTCGTRSSQYRLMKIVSTKYSQTWLDPMNFLGTLLHTHSNLVQCLKIMKLLVMNDEKFNQENIS